MKTARPLSALLALVAFVACGSGDDPVLVTVAGEDLRWSEYRNAYVDYLATTGLEDEPSRRRSFLERLVSKRLVVQEGRDEGLTKTPEYRTFTDRATRRLLVDAFLADAAFDTLRVTQAELEAMFVRVNTTITARHLFASTREEADRLRERLLAGERFEDLAREVFVAPELAESGGSVGSFGFDEMDPAFEDAAHALEIGAISEPVRTAQGWSVIRVDDRAVNPILTVTQFNERIPELSQYVHGKRREAVRREWSDRLKLELSPVLNEATARALLDQINGVAPPETTLPEEAMLVEYHSQGQERGWLVANFRDYAELTSERQRVSVRDMKSLEAFVSGLLVREEMVTRAFEKGLDETPRFRQALSTALEEWLYEKAYERLADRVPVPEDTLRAYFDSHADEFVRPRQVRVREIVSQTKRGADSLLQTVGTADFEDLARRHSVRAASAAVGGDLGWLSAGELGPWSGQVLSAAPGAVLGPFEMRGQYLLLQITDRREELPATFEEVKDDLTTMLAREKQRDFLRDHVNTLRQRYEVRYAEKGPESYPLTALSNRPS